LPSLLGRCSWDEPHSKTELGVDALTILLEEPTCKLGPVFRNDMAWDPKSTNNQPEESDSSTLGNIDHRGGLWPLCELVDGAEEETAPADGPGNGPRISTPHMVNGQEGGIICRA
jgi:hypothetical protein